METARDETEWNDPQPGHSWIDPAGPFQPVRRFLAYAFAIAVLMAFVGGVLGEFTLLSLAVIIGSPAGSLWLGLWFIDTILAYLKR